MLKIHKEGNKIILVSLAGLLVLNFVVFQVFPAAVWLLGAVSLVFFGFILHFFRNPNREILIPDSGVIYAPADGKVVVIEETYEGEYFKDQRVQVSIFMSPTNVHVNRNPMSGTINYFRYHTGKYLVAWHPKSSTENERTTVVIGNGGTEIMLRQIAGALAKRIVAYVHEGDHVLQGKDMGFIKFGSRVDIYLPLGTPIHVKIGEKTVGNRTIIAKI
jgi:phosphatidylserine decarboxylase